MKKDSFDMEEKREYSALSDACFPRTFCHPVIMQLWEEITPIVFALCSFSDEKPNRQITVVGDGNGRVIKQKLSRKAA